MCSIKAVHKCQLRRKERNKEDKFSLTSKFIVVLWYKTMASGSSGKASRLGLADAWGKLRSLRFNQDQTCFVGALDDGLRVFCLDPIREMSHLRHELVGSVSKAEMLYKTNLIAFVGGGKKPRFPDNAVIVYDDRQQEFVLELSLPETVLSVRLKRDKLIAVCRLDMCRTCWFFTLMTFYLSNSCIFFKYV